MMENFVSTDVLKSLLEVLSYGVVAGFGATTVIIFITYGIFKAFGLLNIRT